MSSRCLGDFGQGAGVWILFHVPRFRFDLGRVHSFWRLEGGLIRKTDIERDVTEKGGPASIGTIGCFSLPYFSDF